MKLMGGRANPGRMGGPGPRMATAERGSIRPLGPSFEPHFIRPAAHSNLLQCWSSFAISSPFGHTSFGLALHLPNQWVAILPGIITQIRNSEECTRNFPLLSANKKEPEEGETSKQPKHRSAKRRKRTVDYTEAVPISQIIPDLTTGVSAPYEGKTPLCSACHYHHRAEFACVQCKLVTNHGNWDHKKGN
ncbi:hypothetical protein E3N88_13787 [Mikania micrantha]|uniref:Uncharacterized protein n=1 Tax=Mikania micrantha TaxID=192012 RepID=A0A5N6P0T2_9ASTR|nr:hypothetical protein E3N88_13787 [Mikania micrantha]